MNGLIILIFDYKGKKKGELSLKGLRSKYILEFNSKYIVSICSTLSANDYYSFWSLKTFSLVFKSKQVEPIKGLV